MGRQGHGAAGGGKTGRAGAPAGGGNAPLAALGVADLRTWGAADWAGDAVPHLVCGLVTAASFVAMRAAG